MGDRIIIYDFGANAGQNLGYYLEKADLVVAVEANPLLCRTIKERYAAEIAAGRLVVENVVAVAERGPPTTPFFIHRRKHVLSQLPRPPADLAENFTEIVLPARPVLDIVARHGPPHYIKIDIEHADTAILRSLLANGVRPAYISAEAHDAEIFSLLVAVGGYAALKLVEGNRVGAAFAAHEITTRSGRKVHSFKHHSAGPFGNDIPGPWLDRNTFFQVLGRAGLGWKDIHASLVDRPEPPAPPLAGAASRPAAGVPAQAAPPRHGFLRGEFLVCCDPLLFMTPAGQPIVSSGIDRSAKHRTQEQFHHDADAARSLPEIVHDEPAIVLCCTWDCAFYHFLYETLGKLAVAELHGFTPADHAVYFNTAHTWQRDALRLLGVDPRPLAGGVVHHFRRGVIPSYPRTPSSRPTEESIRFLQRLRSPVADQLPARKLFVTRGRPGSGRTLDNEAEIYDRCFQPRGYDLVDPGTLPFAEQCRLFSQASHVAGPHGAAFSLFCLGRHPVSVIELHSPHYHADCFRYVAQVLGGRYSAFNARQGLFQPADWTVNFTLDQGAIAAWLASLPPGVV